MGFFRGTHARRLPPFNLPSAFRTERVRYDSLPKFRQSPKEYVAMGICVVCTMDEATSKSTTCRKCRAYIHRWGGEKDSRIAGHFDALRVRMRRMTTFAVVKDENVTFVDFEELAKAKVIHLSKRERRRARATVVSIKVAQQLKSQQIRSAFA